MSTSSSVHFLGSNAPHSILPLTESSSLPSHPSNFGAAMMICMVWYEIGEDK